MSSTLRTLYTLALVWLCLSPCFAYAQKPFLSEDANEQLKNLPIEQQDAYLLTQAKQYYAFYTRESYRRAMECYLEALRLAIKHNHPEIVNKCYFGIGAVYDANNNITQAIRYYKLHYQSTLKTRPFNAMAVLRATYNIAASYGKANDSINATYYALKMAEMVPWVNDSMQRAQYQLLIAQTFAVVGNDRDFVAHFNKIPSNIIFKDAELAYGRLYAEAKSHYAKIEGNTKEIITPLLKELQDTKDSIPLLNLVLKAYAGLGDYKNAYTYQQMLIEADQRSLDRNTYGDINYRLLEADNLLKQKLNDELQTNQINNRWKTYFLYTLCILLVIALGITFSLYRRYRVRMRHIDSQNKLIKEHDETNNLLMSEIHHRVKNNLQIISSMVEMQLNNPDADLYFSLQEIQTKMSAIAIAHQMMYEENELQDVNLQRYFEKLVKTSLDVLDVSHRLTQHVHIQDLKLPLDKVITLGIIVNEMLINTVKHVLPCHSNCYISLSCKLIEGELRFSYSDNGPSEEGAITDGRKGMGMRLIEKLANQIDAELHIQKSEHGKIDYLLIFDV